MKSVSNLYPFLISRSVDFDYRVIVSPRFLLDKKLLHLLMAATGNEQETRPRLVLHRQVSEEFTLIFRVEVATRKNIGEDSSEILRDNGFRPIYMILGAVYEGSLSREKVKITSENFQEIYSKIREKYTSFWNEENAQVFLSNSLSPEFNKGVFPETFEVQTLPAYEEGFHQKEPSPLIPQIRPAPRKSKRINNVQLIFLAILAASFLVAGSVLNKFFF